MNWQEQLKAFAQANPDLPQGPEETPDGSSAEPQAASHPRLDISIERKGRAGKTATLITGWQLPDRLLLEVASGLTRRLGAGGSARGGDILIQGDYRQRVLELLSAMGYKCRII